MAGSMMVAKPCDILAAAALLGVFVCRKNKLCPSSAMIVSCGYSHICRCAICWASSYAS
jgi:hypothetical protein